MDDPQLPGVLSDLPWLMELTLARGSFRVVTAPAGSSLMRASMLVATSEDGKLPGRLRCLAGVWEKKRGECEPSRCSLGFGGCSAEAGISTFRGGDAPVRGFLTGEGCIAASPRIFPEGRLVGIGGRGGARPSARGLAAVFRLSWRTAVELEVSGEVE